MKYHVYQIINCATKKRYIGITRVSISTRLNQHWSAAKRKSDNSYLHSSMVKHGRSIFSIHLIHTCESRSVACELERFLIEECTSRYPDGYNLRTGGDGGYEWHDTSKELARQNTSQYFTDPLARQRVSVKAKKSWEDPTVRQRYITSAKNRSSTPAQRADLAARAAKGRANRWAAYRAAQGAA